MRLTQREKMWLGVLMLMGTSYLIDHFWIVPLNMEQERLDSQNMKLQAQINQYRDLQSRYGSPDSQDNIMAECEGMLDRIPESPMTAEVMAFVQFVGHETGVEILSVQYEELVQSDSGSARGMALRPVSQIRFRIKARGCETGIFDFLERMERAPRLFTFSNTRIKKVEPEPYSVVAGEESGDDGPVVIDLLLPGVALTAVDEELHDLYTEFSAYFFDNQDERYTLDLDTPPDT